MRAFERKRDVDRVDAPNSCANKRMQSIRSEKVRKSADRKDEVFFLCISDGAIPNCRDPKRRI